jgi:VirB8 protein
MPNDDFVSPWTSESLTDQAASAFFKAALESRERSEKDTFAVRRQGLIFGVGGIGAAVVMAVACAGVFLRTPLPPPPGYIIVDRAAGTISDPVTAKDVPRYFSATTREAAMMDFIKACESYIPQTWAKLDYHACMIMATPDEQKRRASDIGPDGPRYPQKIFGQTGWAMPTTFLAFDPAAKRGRSRIRHSITNSTMSGLSSLKVRKERSAIRRISILHSTQN